MTKKVKVPGILVCITAWLVLVMGGLLPISLRAQDPPKPATTFSDGFEQGYMFFDYGVGVLHVRQSGSTHEIDYAPGISASKGNFYARLLVPPALQLGGGINGGQSGHGTCKPGAITSDNSFSCIGPFTEWGLPYGGYDGKFDTGIPITHDGATTSIDIYLDVDFAKKVRALGGTTDYRFDWDSALLDSKGQFLQDYIFNVATGLNNGSPKATYTNDTCGGNVPALGGFYVVEAATNSQRGSANAHNPTPDNAPQVCISKSGWYTFRHTFRPDQLNNLEVDMVVLDSDHHVMGSWVLHPTCMSGQAIIGGDGLCSLGAPLPFSAVGSNFYGWFPDQEINDLAIDNVHRKPNDEDGGENHDR